MVLSGRASAQTGLRPNSPHWLSMGGIPGTNRTSFAPPSTRRAIYMWVVNSPRLMTFRSFGVAKWDGVKWTAMSPPTATGQTVEAVATDAAGNLYVGGSFRDFGGD